MNNFIKCINKYTHRVYKQFKCKQIKKLNYELLQGWRH